MAEMKEAGAVAVSDDGRPVMNSQVMRHAMEYARDHGLVIVDHCQDLNLSAGGVMNEGRYSTLLGGNERGGRREPHIPGHPPGGVDRRAGTHRSYFNQGCSGVDS
jgi:hypothetical protein